MLSVRSVTSNASAEDYDLLRVINTEKKITEVDIEIRSLDKTKKKLSKIETKLEETNLLIRSGIGSNQDTLALRATKKFLREKRKGLWDKLAPLPDLQAEKDALVKELDHLRRQIGLL